MPALNPLIDYYKKNNDDLYKRLIISPFINQLNLLEVNNYNHFEITKIDSILLNEQDSFVLPNADQVFVKWYIQMNNNNYKIVIKPNKDNSNIFEIGVYSQLNNDRPDKWFRLFTQNNLIEQGDNIYPFIKLPHPRYFNLERYNSFFEEFLPKNYRDTYFNIYLNELNEDFILNLLKYASSINEFKEKYGPINPNKNQTIPNQTIELNYMPQEIKINSVNTILYGPPGTGKTYHTIELALQALGLTPDDADYKDDKALRKAKKKKFDSLLIKKESENQVEIESKEGKDKQENKEEGRIMFTTFHQSMSYEDFIEGIKPVVKNGNVTYEVQDGIFKKICKKAKADKDNKYMLIIDEINRGNVAAIFGELITLIEDSKRAGEKEAISVTLPYSTDTFSVPNNLYILGTMNTADRSVEALDAALRRRFDFIEMLPQPNLLSDNVEGINLQAVLKTINDRIEALLDRNHLIGHAYLINCETKNDIAQAFNNKIIPLLQEYFYGNYERIAMVLGIGFVNTVEVTKSFAMNNGEIDLSDKKTYTFPKQNEDTIGNAINILLNKTIPTANESEE